MKINITENNEKNGVIVSCGNNNILVSKNSEEWNNEGINKFLVNISVSIPNDEKFEISEYDEKIEGDIYKFVWELFNDFVKEYNTSNK